MIKQFKLVLSKTDKKTKKVDTIILGRQKNYKSVKECYYEAWKMLDSLSDGVDDLEWVFIGGNLLYEDCSYKEKGRKNNTFTHESEEYFYKIEIVCYDK